jgi:hypothetical protein
MSLYAACLPVRFPGPRPVAAWGAGVLVRESGPLAVSISWAHFPSSGNSESSSLLCFQVCNMYKVISV